MKPLLLTLTLLLCIAPSTSAQDFSYRRETRATFWYYESIPYDYGYYRRPLVFPNYRYQPYPIQQTYYPAQWGALPGYYTNGYFIPGW